MAELCSMEKLHYTWQQRMGAMMLHDYFLLMVLLLKPKQNVRFLALLNLIFSWFEIKNKKCGSALFSNLSYFNFFVLVHAEWDDTIAPCCLVLNQIRRMLNCRDIT